MSDEIHALRAISLVELLQIAAQLQPLCGAQLQTYRQVEAALALGFYHGGQVSWLSVDLDQRRPFLIQGDQALEVLARRPKAARPLGLFLRSHFLGRRLKSVTVETERGRILRLAFHSEAPHEAGRVEEPEPHIEIDLIPRHANVVVGNGTVSIAERKPNPLRLQRYQDGEQNQPVSEESGRTWLQLQEEWLAANGKRPSRQAEADGKPDGVDRQTREWQRAIEKKEKALSKMREDLADGSGDLDAEIGEWLKIHGLSELPDRYRDRVDVRRNLAWNIENCFSRVKQSQKKRSGRLERIAKVAAELEQLRARGPGAEAKSAAREKGHLQKVGARGRQFQLADDLVVSIGKSAADNAALLRGARPFDYWLHLREQPGSHGFLRREKSRQVSDQEFALAGAWVVEQSTGKRRHELKDLAYDLLIVECRYVRPIRGALGQVTYTHDRVLRIRL